MFFLYSKDNSLIFFLMLIQVKLFFFYFVLITFMNHSILFNRQRRKDDNNQVQKFLFFIPLLPTGLTFFELIRLKQNIDKYFLQKKKVFYSCVMAFKQKKLYFDLICDCVTAFTLKLYQPTRQLRTLGTQMRTFSNPILLSGASKSAPLLFLVLEIGFECVCIPQ